MLQELAEAASRSGKKAVLLLGILHQSFGNYVDDIHDTKTKNEFGKIEGRFQSFSFVETPAAQLQLLSAAISHKPDIPALFLREVDAFIDKALSLQLHGIAGLGPEDFRQYARKAWPFHPLAMLALPLLFRRYGQNERSVFTFLASNEARGFHDFLNNHDASKLLGLEDIFDYLLVNYEVQLTHHPQGKIFLEANDILNRKNLSANEQTLVKVVAVLSSLGRQSNLKASSALIEYAMRENYSDKVLGKLQTQSILVYRKFSDAFCIWEGSDVDLRECEARAERALDRSGFALAQPLQSALPPRPVIAKRHSFHTGTLRYFAVEYVDSPSDLALVVSRPKEIGQASGRILICFASSDSSIDAFIVMGEELSRCDASLLIAVPGQIDELRLALYEVQRLQWIVNNTEELRDDRIAQREIDLRQAEAHYRVAQLRISLTDPRPAPAGCSCTWVWHGKRQHLNSRKDVAVLLSDVCDHLYQASPRILNEMINRRDISGQAASARNILIKYLNAPERVAQAYLGIEGFPPERSIYECLLQGAGLHQTSQGAWQLTAPVPENAVGLYPCWQLLETEIFGAVKPILLKELYAKMESPPYGVQAGVQPILLTAFYVINRKEVSLYQEGTFLPEPQDAHFELLVRRPDLFAIAGAKITGIRRKIVERLAAGLQTEQSVSAIVRYLYRMLGTLSKYTMNTDRISVRGGAFRQAFTEAKSPERLLFVDLPRVFGLPAVGESEGAAEDFERYFTGLNQSLGELAALLPNLLKEQRAILLSACGLPDTPDGWTTLYERACFLAPKTTNTELIPFLQNIANTAGDWNKAETVIGYMASVPLQNWSAMDIRNFPGLAAGKAELFLEAYRPYSRSVTSLTSAEQDQAAQLQKALMRQLPATDNIAVLRAALLACLDELDQSGG